MGIEAVKNHYLNYLNGFSDIEFKIIDAFGQGDRLVKHWNFKGKHTGDFFGIPATGNYLDLSGTTMITMKDGKIAKEAKQLWAKYDHERPDYNTYVKRMDDRRKADEAEQAKITAELEAMDKIKAEEEKKKANAEKMKDWKHPR